MKKLLSDIGEENKAEEEKQEQGEQEQDLARGKTQMLSEDGISDLKAIDMKKILNRAFKFLPADFVVLDLHVEVPAISLSIVNEYAQSVLSARIEKVDFEMKKAARAYVNFSLQIHDFFVKDEWSPCSEAGIADSRFHFLARTTDEDENDEDPFGD